MKTLAVSLSVYIKWINVLQTIRCTLSDQQVFLFIGIHMMDFPSPSLTRLFWFHAYSCKMFVYVSLSSLQNTCKCIERCEFTVLFWIQQLILVDKNESACFKFLYRLLRLSLILCLTIYWHIFWLNLMLNWCTVCFILLSVIIVYKKYMYLTKGRTCTDCYMEMHWSYLSYR